MAGAKVKLIAVGAVFAVGVMSHAKTVAAPDAPGAAGAAIAWARAQIGKPYLWGGTGPDAFDCSGLVMDAWQSAGISLPRTSQEQWAAGPRVSQPRRGDLVFFAGGDGTASAPGHVGIVTDPVTHTMIDAYGPDGAPITTDTYGLPTSRPGLRDVAG